jgi:hypothetical protein
MGKKDGPESAAGKPMITPFSQANQTFSDAAHAKAQREIYPRLFDVPLSQLSFDDVTGLAIERNKVLDGEMAVDKIVNVTVQRLNAPLVFTVQERFRRTDKMRYEDITITEWNCNSNLPSELYKIKAGLFLYGYYDDLNDKFMGTTVVVSVPSLMLRLASCQIDWHIRINPRSNQRFITIPFTALEEYGTVEMRIVWPLRGH